MMIPFWGGVKSPLPLEPLNPFNPFEINSRLRSGHMSMQVLPKHKDAAIPSGSQMLSTRLRRQPAQRVHLGEGMAVGKPL